jgi:hypothetical protein
MTSIERIDAVFAGHWPDRMPVCEQVFASSVASEIFGRPMLTGSSELYYQEGLAWLEGEKAHEEFAEKLFEDVIAVHDLFAFDVLLMPGTSSTRPAKRIDQYSLLYGDPDGEWSIGRLDPASRTFGIVERSATPTVETVLAGIRSELDSVDREDPPAVSPMLERAQREHGGEFVVGSSSVIVVPMNAPWLEATAVDPGLIAEWLDLRVDRLLAQIEALRQIGIRYINGGGDFAFNSGPVYSPAFFESVMAPRWKRIFDQCREMDVIYVMRSDGNLWPVADSLFGRCRPHAYYEVDEDAGMHFADLRRAFPDLVLIGNVSCDLLRTGTPARVHEKATECLEAAAPRFIGGSANAVLHGTPPENAFALYDAVKQWVPPHQPGTCATPDS